MSDRTEAQERAYLREHARRMRISPERLLEALRPSGFLLVSVDFEDGINELTYVRSSPVHHGLYDRAVVKGSLDGRVASLKLRTSLTPGETVLSSTDCVIDDANWDDADAVACRTEREALNAEARLADAIAPRFENFRAEQEAFGHDTDGTRVAVERYLNLLEMSDSLLESWNALRTQAGDQLVAESDELLKTQLIRAFNLKEFRRVWQIAQLTQRLHWELDSSDLTGFNGLMTKASPGQTEAHRRLQLLASRIAREPGWPIQDPLVPSRQDELEVPVPWRHRRLDSIGQAIEELLTSRESRCKCGHLQHYVDHTMTVVASERQIEIDTRCANGHQDRTHIRLSELSPPA